MNELPKPDCGHLIYTTFVVVLLMALFFVRARRTKE